MTLRPVLLLATLLALIVAAPAGAASKKPAPIPVIGIGEQSPDIFGNYYFSKLRVKHVRIITSWNTLRVRWQRHELDRYMGAAHKVGARVLLGFGHARSRNRDVRRYVPTVKEFLREFKRYKKRYPWVKDWLTWNEANHCGEPTCHKAHRVARFYNNIRHNCYGCNVVAADVLDSPTMVPWIRTFLRTARRDKLIWGLHNYIDANRFRSTGTRELLRATRRVGGQIWFTETGGLVVRRNGSQIAFPGNKRHAARATKQVFRLVRLSPRIRRVYFYHWLPARGRLPSWDSALIDRRGKPRPAYRVLRSWVRKLARAAERRDARKRAERDRGAGGEPTPEPEADPTPTPAPREGTGGASPPPAG
jgi:hypothetical protein